MKGFFEIFLANSSAFSLSENPLCPGIHVRVLTASGEHLEEESIAI